jgi:hypothetical protein
MNRPRHSPPPVLATLADVRQRESKAYAMLNDIEQPVSGNVINALRNHQICPVRWTDRAQVVLKLAA